VRNSVDHGIERPEVRQAAGKNPEGRLSLRAFHEGGQVNIEISDDGAGLDQERIRNKAVQKKLISAEQAGRMSDREIVNLVFLPGFSTAEKVTNVSGRGVGMDVVKTHIEKIGGTVDLQSKPGEGVTGAHEDSANPGHHSGSDRDQRGRPLCGSASQPARTGAPGTGNRRARESR
jgi:two-component system, chemotaxis family, sensor kinase CheA